MRRAFVLSTALVVAGAVCVAVAHGIQSRDLDEPITSVALAGRVHVRIVVPRGYATSHERYPVVYFLHGLPASSGTYRGNDWLIDALQRAGRAILVMPQGARDGDTDPEYLNWGDGRNWGTYISTEIPQWVDRHLRTIPTRSGRAIVGLSAGGYGASVVGFNHLGTFSVIESWSGYFHPTDPTGTRPLDRGPLANVHTLVSLLQRDERHRRTFVAFYVGRSDARFRDENVQLNAELKHADVPHAFAVYPGAHETALWRRHAQAWLSMALRNLARPKP